MKLEGLAAAFLAAALVMAIAATVTVGIVGRATDVACVGDCLTRNALAMQTHAAVAAWATVIVTLATGLLVLRTLHHTRISAQAAVDAVRTTETIGKAQTAAYLALGRVEMDFFADPYQSVIKPTLKNTGQSPARRVWADVRVTLGQIPMTSSSQVEKFSARDIPATIESKPRWPLFIPVEEGDEFPTTIQVIVDLTWLDVFGDHHRDMFVLRASVAPTDLGQTIMLSTG